MRGRAALAALVALVLLATVSAVLIVRMAARSFDATAAAQAAEAPEIARLYIAKFGSLAAAAPTIAKHVTRPGLRVMIRDSATGAMFGERGVFNRRARAGIGIPSGSPPRWSQNRRAPFEPDRIGMVIGLLAGEAPQHVAIAGGDILIFRAPEQILVVVRSVAAGLATIFALGLGALWLYARGVRREAMRPLRETTRSLQRLAARDFTPRTIVSGEGTAYAELACAYNAAVEAVASTFAQRRTAEIEMQRFIADAGHELRTPLTIVMGYLDIIESGGLADPRIAGRVIGGMRTESARMRKLIDKLIVLARMETPSDLDLRGNIDIVALVARVIESLEPLATRAIHIDGVPFAHVYASEDDVAEALSNIIENALKYAPGSDVWVTVERSAERVTVTIADRGPGMSTDEQRNAFERFYRGDRRGEVAGSGLGLAIAKRAIERARGTIVLHSLPQTGTTFLIELPQSAIAIGEPGQLAHH